MIRFRRKGFIFVVSGQDEDIKYDWLYKIAYIIYHRYDLCDTVVVPVCNKLEMIVRDELPVYLLMVKSLLMQFFIQLRLNKTSISTKSDLECLHSR